MAQRGTGDWMTAGFDSQRSSWVRQDAKINPENMVKPGFGDVWKYKLKGTSTPPVLLDFYISYRGFRTLGFVGGKNNTVTGIDTDLARTEWQKDYPAPAKGSAGCPDGMTSAVTRPTSYIYPPMPQGRGFGRGNPARSAVGAPNEGAPILKTLAAAPPPPPPPPAPKPNSAAANAAALANPFAARIQWVNALTSDGLLHSLYVSNGEEPKPGIKFLAPGANAAGLIVINGIAYVTTSGGCGGVTNGVHSLELTTGTHKEWKSKGNGIAGTAGAAFGPDGTLYAAAGAGELVALDATTLQEKAKFVASGVEYTSSPVVFPYGTKNFVAVAGNDGKIRVLDTAALSGAPVAESTAIPNPTVQVGSLTSWQDLAGTRWILASTGNTLRAWKLVEKNGGLSLDRAWAKGDLVNALPPAIVGGVAFVISGGDAKTPAVLYGIDALSGKEYWSSGKAIAGQVTTGGLSAGGSRVYVSTTDGTQYTFGFPIEH